MSLTVCTGWSPAGYREYGMRFAETFDRYWPKDVELVVYGEELCTLPRGSFRLLSEIPGCVEFIERHKADPLKNGRAPPPGVMWKASELAAGYSFKWDAVKFSRQGFIPLDAMDHCTTDFLCWLDADVVTFKPVPPKAIEQLLPWGISIAYLGREPKWPDIAFQLYRVNPTAAGFLEDFRDLYNEDYIFKLPQWHSAYAWQHCAKKWRQSTRDLTPGGSGHVWFQSPLGKWTDHLKGNRKQTGQSRERR